MLRFDGHFQLARPLGELATVLDMTGIALSVHGIDIRSDDPDFSMRIAGRSGDRYRIAGTVEATRAEILLQRLAAAFEADGIGYLLTLYDATGERQCVLEHG